GGWNEPELAAGCAFLGRKIWQRLVVAEIAPKEPQAPPPSGALPPPQLPAPAPEARFRIIDPWSADERAGEAPPHYPSREEMGLP
ncbi:MAG: hypothetical protein ABI423_09060, partial [Burkholderiales bacterium]